MEKESDVELIDVLNADSITELELGPNAKDSGSVSITEEFINGTNMTVFVRLRSGILMPISPGNTQNGFFTIRVTLSMPAKTCNSVYNQLLASTNANFENPEKELYKKALKEALDKATSSQLGAYRTKASLDYNVSIDTLRKHGTIYLRDVDFIVSVAMEHNVPYHHHSHETAYSAVAKLLESDIKAGLEFSFVRVINHKSQEKPLYILHAGRPCRVKSIVLPDALPGYYYYCGGLNEETDFVGVDESQHLMELTGINKHEVRYYPLLDDLIEMGFVVYDNRLKADQAKDRRLDHEITLMDKKASITMLEVNHKETALALESQLDEAKKRQAITDTILKEKEKEYDFKLTTMKHQYEAQSLARKDSSETLKWIPALITGLGAVLGVFKLFR